MEQEKNPDWKQWIPVYGIYQSTKDNRNGKPSLYGNMENHSIRYWGSIIYHSITSGATLGFISEKGLKKLLDKLLN